MAVDQQARYASLLLSWNQRLNLTGARTEAELARHLRDAHALLEASWEGIARLVDVGSGGGLPAIPLALALPGVGFTLVEANRRKAAFLEHVAGELAMGNLNVVCGRAEEIARQPVHREAYDRAISRAAARPAVLLELALPLVRVGGDLLAVVGELDPGALAGAASCLGAQAPWLERTGDGSPLLRTRKQRSTPAEFPRRFQVMSRRPLA
jgi:16S rRNA (guanine527-N7)-methyltransferase